MLLPGGDMALQEARARGACGSAYSLGQSREGFSQAIPPLRGRSSQGRGEARAILKPPGAAWGHQQGKSCAGQCLGMG